VTLQTALTRTITSELQLHQSHDVLPTEDAKLTVKALKASTDCLILANKHADY